MAQYTKKTVDNKVQYLLDGKEVNGAKVPLEVRNALAEAKDGTLVDETAQPVNPETDTDESEDETTPQDPNSTENQDGDGPGSDGDENSEGDNGEETAETEEQKAARENAERVKAANEAGDPGKQKQPEVPPQPANSDVEQDEKGMGYKRGKGKTLSIFSNKPHETVKYVAGETVPLTMEEYRTKTDAEIIAQLKKIGKL